MIENVKETHLNETDPFPFTKMKKNVHQLFGVSRWVTFKNLLLKYAQIFCHRRLDGYVTVRHKRFSWQTWDETGFLKAATMYAKLANER